MKVVKIIEKESTGFVNINVDLQNKFMTISAGDLSGQVDISIVAEVAKMDLVDINNYFRTAVKLALDVKDKDIEG